MRVLVTGATGFIGSRLVPALRAAGHEVVVLVRDADRYGGTESPGADGRSGPDDADTAVRVLEGDLLAPEDVRLVTGPGETTPQPLGRWLAALDCDAAYYLVHSMGESDDFAETDRRAAEAFRAAADEGGLDRVIYLGGLGDEAEEELSEHLRSRREVGRILGEGKYDLVTLRAAVIVGDGSASFEIIRQLAARLPVMVTPRWVRTECQPIFVDDVIAYLVGVLDAPAAAGGVYDIGGPDVLTYEEVLRRTREALGGRLFVVPVPVLTPRLSSRWVRLVTDVPRGVVDPLVDGLRTPVVADDAAIRELVPVELTPFDEAVRTALARRDDRIDPGDREDRDDRADPSDERTTEPAGGAAGGADGDAADRPRTATDDSADSERST
ncbi:NAD-dependent epimerase/dehydratase family protein [Halobaculum roseum]|uniref:NAD-dependent epimerase/dehydratase family protein n=1 Tax=Halobaculum roseum TaxID=2175149 RepID=A0ABD5MLD3_9EURY|nr:NAD-dependent epimerase/dehydratase family protein [Halobaculum roseum]QZY01283.1 NAD-dependent epimerase/dehydratase family protein [Halobaculum roseum]